MCQRLYDVRMHERTVFLLHGIAQRDPDFVGKCAEQLQGGLAGCGCQVRLVPIYWGDLAPRTEHLDAVLGHHQKACDSFWDAAANTLSRPAVRGLAHARSWLLKRQGKREAGQRLRQMGRARSRELRSGAYGWKAEQFRSGRLAVTKQTMRFFADVLAYQSHAFRDRVHQRVWQVIQRELGPNAGTAEQPIDLVAHSLGGIISFDMATHPQVPLHLRPLGDSGQPGRSVPCDRPAPGRHTL